MNLLVVRHGESLANTQNICAPSDSPLTDHGREQATQAAKQLAAQHFSAIVSSPMLRARQTAEIIRDAIAPGVAITLDDHFAEIGVGDMVGRPAAEYYAKLKAGQAIAGAETPEAMLERVQAGLQSLRARNAPILLVTHEITIQMIEVALRDWPVGRLLDVPGQGNGQVKEVAL